MYSWEQAGRGVREGSALASWALTLVPTPEANTAGTDAGVHPVSHWLQQKGVRIQSWDFGPELLDSNPESTTSSYVI